MAEVDRIMVDERAVSLLQMMENAGRALAIVARDTLGGDVGGRRILVLAGSGGNGGGAMAAARRLHAWGARPLVLTTRPPTAYTGAPGHQLRTLGRMGVPVRTAQSLREGTRAEVVLDGILGYGLTGDPRDAAAALVRRANAGTEPVVALDTPSGLDVDSGRRHRPTVVAAATVTLALPKPGLLAPDAAEHVGRLYLADLGIPAEVFAAVGIEVGPVFSRSDLVRLTLRRHDRVGISNQAKAVGPHGSTRRDGARRQRDPVRPRAATDPLR
jgi:NAD(P)H-hydrate epimerase